MVLSISIRAAAAISFTINPRRGRRRTESSSGSRRALNSVKYARYRRGLTIAAGDLAIGGRLRRSRHTGGARIPGLRDSIRRVEGKGRE